MIFCKFNQKSLKTKIISIKNCLLAIIFMLCATTCFHFARAHPAFPNRFLAQLKTMQQCLNIKNIWL